MSVIQIYGCDQKGRRLRWGVKQVSFQVFPEGCDRGNVSYLARKRVPKSWGIVTERIRKVLV